MDSARLWKALAFGTRMSSETGEREGSVFTSAKKAYYKRDERKSDLLSRERTFTSPGPWALSLSALGAKERSPTLARGLLIQSWS